MVGVAGVGSRVHNELGGIIAEGDAEQVAEEKAAGTADRSGTPETPQKAGRNTRGSTSAGLARQAAAGHPSAGAGAGRRGLPCQGGRE